MQAAQFWRKFRNGIFLALFFALPAHAVLLDWGKYLETYPMLLSEDPMPGNGHEMYVSHDPAKNKFLMMVNFDDRLIYSDAMVRQIFALLDVPAGPYHPVFIKRGEVAYPLARARSFFKHLSIHSGPEANLTEWTTGFLAPSWDYKDGYFPEKEFKWLGPRALTDIVIATCLSRLMLITDKLYLSVEGDRVSMGYNPTPFSRFTAYSQDSSVTFAKTLANLSHSELRYAVNAVNAYLRNPGSADAALFLNAINQFISRVESYVASDESGTSVFENIVLPGLVAGRHPRADLAWEGFLARARNLRQEILTWGKSVNRNFELPGPLKYAGLNANYVSLAKYILAPEAPVPAFELGWEMRAKEHLLYYYFSPGPKKVQMLTEWKERLGVEDPIGHLLEMARRYDSHTIGVSPRRIDLAHEVGAFPQHFVNTRNLRTLVIAPSEPAHAHGVLSIVGNIRKAYGEHADKFIGLIQVSGDGGKLADLIDHAAAEGYGRVMVVNFGSSPFDWEVAASGRVELINLDTDTTFSSKLSPAERLAAHYNYFLTWDEKLSAMLQRAGISGLRAIGLREDEIRSVLDSRGEMRRMGGATMDIAKHLPAFSEEIAPFTLLRLETPREDRAETWHALQWATRNRPNADLLVVGPSQTIFCGDDDVCRKLVAESRSGAAYWLGRGLQSAVAIDANSPRDAKERLRVGEEMERKLLLIKQYRCLRRIVQTASGAT